ncbi:MAG: NUDIX hydrolase [Gemmatimonadales bacterium]
MLLSTTRRYSGRIIHVDADRVQFPDGSEGTLEMIRHPGASAVVPMLDPPTDPDPRVLLIRQFRHAADDFIWEIPAGTLDAGEDPAECARRELAEEAGCSAGRIEHLSTVFTTPGFTDERIHLYLATDLERGETRPEHDEFLSVHEWRWSEIGRMIRRGEIRDAKSLCALFFVQSFQRA